MTKVALVTGASRGIGQATAVALARDGAQIVAAGRDVSALERTQALVKKGGGQCQVQRLDVTDRETVKRCVHTVIEELGRIDILVNNAGSVELSSMQEYDLAAFDNLMAVNCNGLFYCCRAVWPHMMSNRSGTIVNISSMSAKDPYPGLGAYGASKRWVNGLTEALAAEGRPHGIRVFAVAPGAVATDMLHGLFPDFPENQCLTPGQVADVVSWLVDSRSHCASGNVIYISASS